MDKLTEDLSRHHFVVLSFWRYKYFAFKSMRRNVGYAEEMKVIIGFDFLSSGSILYGREHVEFIISCCL